MISEPGIIVEGLGAPSTIGLNCNVTGFFDPVEDLWKNHVNNKLDATFYDHIVDGSGFEILSLETLKISHKKGEPEFMLNWRLKAYHHFMKLLD